ncbi:MAG TPA: dihydrolipoamide acetyltransferase family protein [Candidatus Aquicultor sp.]|jgi:2-oxoglutarate dehydrogenase complex dihydrolipoamide succinyltransferase (E2) component
MTVPLTLPRLGETVTEGTVVRWLKKEGDFVNKDENYVEIETAKIETEIPSPVSGRIEKIIVNEGETVPVGTELAIVDETAAAGGAAPQEVPPTAAPPAEAGKAPAAPEKPAGEETFVSPLVRKLARENNVDLAKIKGTGFRGRITRHDVQNYVAAQKAAPTAAAMAAERPSAAPALPPAPAEQPAAAAPQPAPEYPGERIVQMNILRREIAGHMVRSHQTSAHVTAIVDVDMTNVAKQRNKVKEEFKKREGFSLTYLPFVARATIDALFAFPTVNARIIDEQHMGLHDYVNLGIAVSVENGLIVPVIKNAQDMSLTGLAYQIHDLADKTRSGKVKLDEVTGSTFTITNPGSFGSLIQTPIINQPNVAILSLEMIQRRPTVIDDAIAIRDMVYMPLTYDHRLIDGAIAAQFLNRIKHSLETWDFSPDLGL